MSAIPYPFSKMILPNKVLRSKRWQAASPSARWAWYEGQRLVQTVLHRLPSLDDLIAIGVTPNSLLFQQHGDLWEPIGVPWGEMKRRQKCAENLPSTDENAELGEKDRARANHSSSDKLTEHGQKHRARTKTPSTDESGATGTLAQPARNQKERGETTATPESPQNSEKGKTSDCSTPLDPPIYIYNKKKKKKNKFIGVGVEGGGGEQIPEWVQKLRFQTREGERILTASEFANLQQGFGESAVKRELGRACVWLYANPKRRKASSGLFRFLAGWIQRTRRDGAQKEPSDKSWNCASSQPDKSWRAGL